MGFAKHFVWGAATSSYQIEGTGRDSGKGQNIWDVFTKEPGRVYEGHTGDIACDHYHRFREDVAYMKELGLKGYRFSIDWSRVLPEGTGKVSFATSVVTYFNMFAQLGIPTYGICACAKVRDDKEALSRTIHELLIINLIMSAFTYFVLGICLVTVPRFQTEKTLFSIVSTTILFNAVGVAL